MCPMIARVGDWPVCPMIARVGDWLGAGVAWDVLSSISCCHGAGVPF